MDDGMEQNLLLARKLPLGKSREGHSSLYLTSSPKATEKENDWKEPGSWMLGMSVISWKCKSNSNHMLANTYVHVAHTYAQPIQFCCIVLSLQVTIRTPISHSHSFPGFPPGSDEEGTSHPPSPLQGRLNSSFFRYSCFLL